MQKISQIVAALGPLSALLDRVGFSVPLGTPRDHTFVIQWARHGERDTVSTVREIQWERDTVMRDCLPGKAASSLLLHSKEFKTKISHAHSLIHSHHHSALYLLFWWDQSNSRSNFLMLILCMFLSLCISWVAVSMRPAASQWELRLTHYWLSSCLSVAGSLGLAVQCGVFSGRVVSH